jgi:hypothetical protein
MTTLHEDWGLLERLRPASLVTALNLTWAAARPRLLTMCRETFEAHLGS